MIYFRLTTSGIANWRGAKGQITALINGVFSEVIRRWHKNTLPKHFRPGAERVYHYAKRSKSHQRRKENRFGHRTPLVFTGALKRQVAAGILLRATKTTPKVKGKMRGPWYLRPAGRPIMGKGFSGKMPDMGTEITAISNFEQANIERMVKARVARGLKKLGKRNRRTRKIA